MFIYIFFDIFGGFIFSILRHLLFFWYIYLCINTCEVLISSMSNTYICCLTVHHHIRVQLCQLDLSLSQNSILL